MLKTPKKKIKKRTFYPLVLSPENKKLLQKCKKKTGTPMNFLINQAVNLMLNNKKK